MKKIFKTILIVIAVLVLAWLIIFSTDYVRCANLKMPIFVKAGQTVDDGGSGTYYGLGYKVEVQKYLSAEYGVQLEKVEMYFFNKCIAGAITEIEKQFVKITDGKIENEYLIDKFIEDANNAKQAVLEINNNGKNIKVTYTPNDVQGEDEYCNLIYRWRKNNNKSS